MKHRGRDSVIVGGVLLYGGVQLVSGFAYARTVPYHGLWEFPSIHPAIHKPIEIPAFVETPNFDSTGVNSITVGFEYPPVEWKPDFP